MLISVVFINACSTSGSPRIISENQVEKMAEAAWKNTLQKYPKSNDSKVLSRVDNVSEILVSESDFKDESWEIVVFEHPTFRSFSLPTNKIGINSRLINYVDNDDQVAFVIGSLIASSKSDEAIDRINRQFLSQALIGGPTIFNSRKTTEQRKANQSLDQVLKYDTESLRLMDKAGFSILEARTFLQKLRSESNSGLQNQIEARIENFEKYKAVK